MVIPDGEAAPGPVAPAFPPSVPNIDYGARLRTGFFTFDSTDPKGLGDVGALLATDLWMTGAITKIVKWQIGVTGQFNGVPNPAKANPNLRESFSASAEILDAVARFEFMPEFNIYAGRMIVIADRYTPSGPWGMDEFIYPGIMNPGAVPAALMRSGSVGRDLGMNVWGAIAGGLVKYYLGAYEFNDATLSPLLSGRLQVSLLSGEPGFYQRHTYYGYKDLISIGVGGQYQKNGSVTTIPAMPMAMPPTMAMTLADNYSYLTADLVIDKKLGDAGTVSLNGSFAKFDGDYNPWKSHFLVSVGYLIPGVVGVGKIRPSIRFQGAQSAAMGSALSTVIDAQIGYVIMPWFARVAIGYRNFSTDLGKGATKGHQLFLGITVGDP